MFDALNHCTTATTVSLASWFSRAELRVTSLNAACGLVVKLSFDDMHKKCWKLIVSQVVLHWIRCTRSTLRMWVRNRVIEINRLAGT